MLIRDQQWQDGESTLAIIEEICELLEKRVTKPYVLANINKLFERKNNLRVGFYANMNAFKLINRNHPEVSHGYGSSSISNLSKDALTFSMHGSPTSQFDISGLQADNSLKVLNSELKPGEFMSNSSVVPTNHVIKVAMDPNAGNKEPADPIVIIECKEDDQKNSKICVQLFLSIVISLIVLLFILAAFFNNHHG